MKDKLLLSIMITLLLGSYGWSATIYQWSLASAEDKDRAVIVQVEEIKENVNARLDRQYARNSAQTQRILDALKNLQDEIRQNGM